MLKHVYYQRHILIDSVNLAIPIDLKNPLKKKKKKRKKKKEKRKKKKEKTLRIWITMSLSSVFKIN